MIISYQKLWGLLSQRGLTKSDLIRMSKVSRTTISNMQKGDNVNLDILRRICETLRVNLGDIAEFVEESTKARR